MHNRSKIWFVNHKFSLSKVLQLTGHQGCYFLIFVFFILSNFKWLLSQIFKKPLFFIMDFESPYEILQRHKYFWSKNLWQSKDGPFKNFCAEMRFVSLFSLNEKTITNLLWMIHLTCTVLHYANINSNFINKNFKIMGRQICYFVFLDFLFMFILTRLLAKTLWRNYNF